jgi:uncharacterized phage-associated protein
MIRSGMGVSFTFDPEKAAAAIAWLASRNLPDLSKGKICKLLFLADKHHLVRFGRPITGDRICAMKDGPVPSHTLNMLNQALAGAEPADSLLSGAVTINRTFANPHFEAKDFRLGDFLSESDLEALNSIAQTYGGKTFSELRRITHDMPAYNKAWHEDRPHDSPRMAFEDFFEEDDEAIQGALEEMTENAGLRKAFAADL